MVIRWLAVFEVKQEPTKWWGRQNAAPPKVDPKPPEAAFWTIFLNFHKCLPAQLMSSYLRGSKLGRHGCHVKLGDSSTNHSRDIRAAQFVMDDERRYSTLCLKIQLVIAAYCQHDGPHLTDSQWYFCVLTFVLLCLTSLCGCIGH